MMENNELKFQGRVALNDDGWSIGVPDGFEYSTDLNVNGNTKATNSGKYDLIIAKAKKTETVTFHFPYDNMISFVTLYQGNTGIDRDRLDDPSARIALLANIPLFKSYEWKPVIAESDLLVYYTFFAAANRVASYYGLIITPEKWRHCQAVVGGNTKKDVKEDFVKQLLGSVKRI